MAVTKSGTDAEARDFFKEPLTRAEIKEIAKRSSVREMFSWNSPSSKPYRERRDELSDEELIDLMMSEPRLVRRPILIVGDKVLFGFRSKEYAETLGTES